MLTHHKKPLTESFQFSDNNFMIMQLLKNDTAVLTVRSDHTKDNSGADLPITYEGDLTLYPNRWDEASVDMLEGRLSLIADQQGFELAGDYRE